MHKEWRHQDITNKLMFRRFRPSNPRDLQVFLPDKECAQALLQGGLYSGKQGIAVLGMHFEIRPCMLLAHSKNVAAYEMPI